MFAARGGEGGALGRGQKNVDRFSWHGNVCDVSQMSQGRNAIPIVYYLIHV